jgi:hypothetical protein
MWVPWFPEISSSKLLEKKNMKPILPSLFLAALFAWTAQADPIFVLVPSGGTISGNSGGIVGWGYDVTNNDPANWLVLDDSFATGSLASGTFGTYMDYIASTFIVIDPSQSGGTVLFSQGTSGTGEFDIDAVVPPNMVIPGSIGLDYSLFSEDPNSPTFDPSSLVTNGTVFATAQVNVNTTAVPEPGSLWFAVAWLLPFAWVVRQRRRTWLSPEQR